MIEHFHEHGWVAVEALDRMQSAALAGWVDEVASLPDGSGGILQHFEGTDAGPMLCRSENFVPIHDALRALLCEGPLVEVAGALLGEPAVLYKEKINYKLAGRRRLLAPPGRACVPADPRARLRDGRGRRRRRRQRRPRGRVRPLRRGAAHSTRRGASSLGRRRVRLGPRCRCRAGQTLWFHSRTPHRSGPNHSDRPARALYPTYNAASEGDLRAAYYDAKRAAFAPAAVGDRRAVSLIGDFEGRPV